MQAVILMDEIYYIPWVVGWFGFTKKQRGMIFLPTSMGLSWWVTICHLYSNFLSWCFWIEPWITSFDLAKSEAFGSFKKKKTLHASPRQMEGLMVGVKPTPANLTQKKHTHGIPSLVRNPKIPPEMFWTEQGHFLVKKWYISWLKEIKIGAGGWLI